MSGALPKPASAAYEAAVERAPEVLYEAMDEATADRVIATLSGHATERRLARLRATIATRTRDVAIVLEDVANAHNAAAVLRSAEAFGFFEVHVVEPEDGRFRISSNIASGAHKWLDLHWYRESHAAYGALKGRGHTVWASDIHGDSVDVDQIDVSGPIALVFGNEHRGVSPGAVTAADGRFRVPMSGFVESLNISVAAAVSGYDVLSRRKALGASVGLEGLDAKRVLAAWLAKSVGAAPQILARPELPIPVMGRMAFPLE